MRRLHTAFLMPGMIAGEDVFSLHDQLLIPKDTVLTDAMISTLSIHGVVNVLIKDKPKTQPAVVGPDATYSEKIKNSAEFLQFKDAYEEKVNSLRSKINFASEENTKLDMSDLYSDIQQTFKQLSSGSGIFDMLQHMREYDDSTFAHSINVALLCNIMANWLKFSEKDIETATISGLLHDIGKTQISQEILNKPGKLTKEEYDIVKRHTVAGYQFLRERGANLDICNAALMHHERCDGSGYPLGLSGRDISKFAKVVAIADAYDAMTAARLYRGPLCPFNVISLFEQEGLQKYDPAYILPFLENVVNSYISFSCELSDGRRGTIVYINKHKLGRPVVSCDGEYVDLASNPHLEIVSLI
ncbi:MAG: HD-GYP domain-containing protein [Lachnospiraceae bacterium]|nr:HD-GYP domain-containing protein [Lachnospiraceae bacterium]